MIYSAPLSCNFVKGAKLIKSLKAHIKFQLKFMALSVYGKNSFVASIRFLNFCNWIWGAGIAQWICLHLPYCHPGFESQAHHLHTILSIYIWYESCEKDENKQKEAGIWTFLNWPPPAFLFSQEYEFIAQESNIWCRDLNWKCLINESPPITTRPEAKIKSYQWSSITNEPLEGFRSVWL